MAVPTRTGIRRDDLQRRVSQLDAARDRALRRVPDRTDLGGVAVLWTWQGHRLSSREFAIQPGVADDLPSLLSTLSVDLAWPGVASSSISGADLAQPAVAVWARVWQVRDGADLRLLLFWDEHGIFNATAQLLAPDGTAHDALPASDLLGLLNRVAAHPQASESPHGLLVAGNRAMEAGEYATARACYEAAIRDLPRHPEAHRNLAIVLARQGAWEEAAATMRDALNLTPHDVQLTQEYQALKTDAGVVAVQAQDLERAATHFLDILARWPDDPTALVNLGNIRLRQQRPREAHAIFTRFLRLHPKHAAAEQVRLALATLDGEEPQV